MKIEALHEFHNKDFSKGWADRFTPTPPRIELFETILERIKTLGDSSCHIVELGIGPGYLAHFLLSRLENITYEGVDYALPMLDLAAERLSEFKDRTTFTQADLTDPNWINAIRQPKAIVTTWALHDLFNADNILSVYQNTQKVLIENGIFLNGDFIKPDLVEFEYEAGRLEKNTHLDLLQLAGFQSIDCIKEFEKNIDQPTTSNNYACFEARKFSK